MAWYDEPEHSFAGIAEKLHRAEENIINLNSEIEAFFNKSDYPAIPEHNTEVLLNALEYHKSRPIPPRFSILAGEIVHHLRSCFDHIVWKFSVGPQLNKMPIQFPILTKQPVKEQEIARYNGNIQRVIDTKAREEIEGLQPYHASDPFDDPLFIIHHFDIIDKHQEPLFCINAGTRVVPIELMPIIESYQRAHPEFHPAQVQSQLKGYGPLQPCIAFRNFGKRKLEPAIPGLVNLLRFTFRQVGKFADL